MDLSKYKEPITMSMVIDSHHVASILEQHREELVSEVDRLQKMVEKMRNCDNCKHEIGCGYCDADYDKWEIAE